MATNTSDAAAHTKELREDLDALRADMKSLMDHVRSASGDAASGMKAKIHDMSSEAGDQMTAAKAVADRKISEHPMTSVAIAFGIGMLLGKLMDRRGS